ncbi:CDA_G0047590.mRNA.1.CDS.1 [Saccharomyces cerevisiae]|nr:CDA_G0047590.mRNA.1.CDS.1 [Saccharomyces cerevisiae]CAI7451805.1 CDA_G0047590.mRNA.1.CDS.1 [Saccharomyces cerevisiae]
MLTGIAPDQVTRMITGVPWYSSRLKPAISVLYPRTTYLINDGVHEAFLNMINIERNFTYCRKSVDGNKANRYVQ